MGKNNRNHLLVIRLSAMGDVAMTVPVLHALLQQNPQLEITVLSKGFFKPMFASLPKLTFYEADVKGKHKGILGLFKLYKELKALKIDAVADVHNVLRSTILKFFFTLGGIPVSQIDKGRAEKKALTSGKEFKPLKSTQQRYVGVFKALGFDITLSSASSLPKPKLNAAVSQLVESSSNLRIGIAPFAAHEGKMYPLDLMEKVVDGLQQNNDHHIYLFGGGDKEGKILAQWQEQFVGVTSVVGGLSFEEELSLIAHLDVMLSMDSGNGHLAAMYGVPVVSLWGVTHPYTGFVPFNQPIENSLLADRKQYPLIPTSVYGNKVPSGYERVMETIDPKAVIEKVIEVSRKS